MKISILTILLTLLATSANANLIVNGGFEDTVVNNNNGGWQWYHSANVAGWSGSNIEIWEDFGAIGAYEGSKHAELNAHPNRRRAFSIYQTFATTADQSYDLFFAYGARRNNNEAFRVDVLNGSDNTIWSQLMNDHTKNEWSTLTTSFIAESDETTLRFTSITPRAGTYGNFLDDIRVTSVPEPGTLTLLALGLAGLGISRKNQRKA